MILCCGEALIDMLPVQTANGQTGYVPHAGGAVFNTAIALGRLGVETGFLSGLSRDMWGRILGDELLRSHVDPSYSVISGRPTTLAFVRLEDGHASYSFHDENSAMRMITAEDLPELPDTVAALFFGGISLCSPPFCNTLLHLAESEAGRRLIMLDPNIRPGFIQDAEAHRDRIMRMIAAADIVKVSDEDLAWIYPGLNGPEAQVAMMLTSGPAIALLTRGGEGATAFTATGHSVHRAARPTVVADTVGAGDTFNAGFLARIAGLDLLTRPDLARISDDSLAECLDLAARAAAVTVSRAGANPPWAHELDL